MTEENTTRANFILRVSKRDKRCKNGLRLIKTYPYNDVDVAWMGEELRELRNTLYRPDNGYWLTVSQVK